MAGTEIARASSADDILNSESHKTPKTKATRSQQAGKLTPAARQISGSSGLNTPPGARSPVRRASPKTVESLSPISLTPSSSRSHSPAAPAARKLITEIRTSAKRCWAFITYFFTVLAVNCYRYIISVIDIDDNVYWLVLYSKLFLSASRPVAKGMVLGVKPPERFAEKISGDIFWLTSSYNAPKCIISTPKPYKLQSVAKRLMILSLFFYLLQNSVSWFSGNCCQKTSDFTSKMHQIRCRLWLRLQCSPRPPSWI